MNITVNNLNLGYEQCAELNNLVATSGENLLGNLQTTINNLKAHWVGSDATNHINNLIVVYNVLASILTDAKRVTSDAGNAIIAIQTVRNANGGGSSVGDMLPAEGPNTSLIPNAEPTDRYFVDPAATNDLAMLQEECSSYATFIEQFRSRKEELLGNWLDGANREYAVNAFGEFESNSDVYYKYLVEARDNLSTAVSNINQL